MVTFTMTRVSLAPAFVCRAWAASLPVLAALALPACAASRDSDGKVFVEQQGALICFRVETFKDPSVFAPGAQDVDRERVVARSLEVGRYTGAGYGVAWRAAHPVDEYGRGIRLDRKTRWCYGKAPDGFVATVPAQPLSAGRFRVRIDASNILEPIENSESADFASEFCLAGRAGELRLSPCGVAGKPTSP